jgi:hypothetical protein
VSPTPEQLAADAAEEITPGATVPGLADLVAQMATCKARLDELEEQRKALQSHYDDLRKHLVPERLQSSSLTRASFSIGTLSLRHKTYARIVKTREAEARAWCLSTGNEHLLVVQPTALLGLVNYLVGSGSAVPGFITMYTEEVAVLTTAKRSSEE